MSTVNENPTCRACLITTGDFASIHWTVATEGTKMELTLQDCWRQCMLWCGEENLDDIEDMLPDYLCMQCSQDIQVAYNFLKTAIQSMSTFRKQIVLNKCKEEYVEPLPESVKEEFDISEVKEELTFGNYELFERELETEHLEDFEADKQVNDYEKNEECIIAESHHDMSKNVDIVDLSSDNDSNQGEELEGNDAAPYTKIENSEPDLEVVCVCGEKIQYSEMKSHQLKCSSNTRGITCRVCFVNFADRPSLAAHKREIHINDLKDSAFRCKICNNLYRTRTQLHRHLKRHQARIYKSEKCEIDISLAKKKLTQDLPYKCDKCPAAYRYSGTLQAHKGREHLARCFVCKVAGCGARFRSQLQLNAHKYKHVGNPYKCEHCSEDFLNREIFRTHNETSHNICLTEGELTKIYQKHMQNAYDETNLAEELL